MSDPVGINKVPDVGSSAAPDVGQNPSSFQQSAPRLFRLTFKQNRKFELTKQGYDTLFFYPPENLRVKNVPEAFINAMTEYEKAFFNIEVM